jgi:hypothetical protein
MTFPRRVCGFVGLCTFVLSLGVACGGATTGSTRKTDSGESGGASSGGITGSGGVMSTGSGGIASTGSGGTTNTGSGGASGFGGIGGTGGTSGLEQCAPVVFHMISGGPADASSFCVGSPSGCGGTWLTINDPNGKPINPDLPFCTLDCAGCVREICPPIACAFSQPLLSAGIDSTWSGESWQSSDACGADGCLARSCAVPGRYTAHMCGYSLTAADGSITECQTTASKTPTCVDVPFDYPGTASVVGALDPRN